MKGVKGGGGKPGCRNRAMGGAPRSPGVAQARRRGGPGVPAGSARRGPETGPMMPRRRARAPRCPTLGGAAAATAAAALGRDSAPEPEAS